MLFEPEDIKLSQTSSEVAGATLFLRVCRTGKLKSIGKKREQVVLLLPTHGLNPLPILEQAIMK